MQTLFPVQRPQLLLMPQPSEPQMRPLQFGTHVGGGLGDGFLSLFLRFLDFFFFFFFFFRFFFLFLRLADASSLARKRGRKLSRRPRAAVMRAVPRRERGSPSARASRSNCASSTPRHPGRHPCSHASLPGAQARNHARDWVSVHDGNWWCGGGGRRVESDSLIRGAVARSKTRWGRQEFLAAPRLPELASVCFSSRT
jgi:hypothetical protein